jgi:hypothetical protein
MTNRVGKPAADAGEIDESSCWLSFWSSLSTTRRENYSTRWHSQSASPCLVPPPLALHWSENLWR